MLRTDTNHKENTTMRPLSDWRAEIVNVPEASPIAEMLRTAYDTARPIRVDGPMIITSLTIDHLPDGTATYSFEMRGSAPDGPAVHPTHG